jgi:hypothetical protein
MSGVLRLTCLDVAFPASGIRLPVGPDAVVVAWMPEAWMPNL